MRLLVGLLLSAIVLSGCSDTPSADGGDASVSSSSSSASGTTTAAGNTTTSRSSSTTATSSSTGTTTSSANTTTTSSNSTATTSSTNTTTSSSNTTTSGTGGSANPVTKSCTITFQGTMVPGQFTGGLGASSCTMAEHNSVSGDNFHSMLVQVTWSNGATPAPNDLAFPITAGSAALATVSGASPIRVEFADANVPDAAKFTVTAAARFTGAVNLSATVKVTFFETATVPAGFSA